MPAERAVSDTEAAVAPVDAPAADPAHPVIINVERPNGAAGAAEDEFVDAKDAPNYEDFTLFLGALRSEAPAEQLAALLAEREIDLNLPIPGSNDFRLSYLTTTVHETLEPAAGRACIETLVKRKADPNAVDGTGRTAVMYAAMRGQRDVLAALLDCGALVGTAIDEEKEFAASLKSMGRNALELAVEEGEIECVRELLAHGADLRDAAGRFSPLFLACLLGKTDVCSELLAGGAPVLATDKNGFTALMAAADSGNVGCVRALLAARASHTSVEPSNGRSALMLAAHASGGPHLLRFDFAKPPESAFVECVKALLEAGADTDAHSNAAGREFTPLLYAASAGRTLVVRALLAKGVDQNTRAQTSAEGLSALAIALAGGHEWTAKALCAAGAYPYSPREPRELFTRALLSANAETLAEEHRAMLERMDAWLQTRQAWRSPLHFAEELTPAHATALLRAGADVHLPAARRKGGGGTAVAPSDGAAAVAGAGAPAAASGEEAAAEHAEQHALETPATIAREAVARLEREGRTDSPNFKAASLVASAALPWSPETHALFPSRARARAVSLLCIGKQVARQYGTAGGADGSALMRAWIAHVQPRLVERSFLEPGTVVRIGGLTAAASLDLNGQCGVVQCATATEMTSGRVPVLVGAPTDDDGANGGARPAGGRAQKATAAGAAGRRIGARVGHLSVVRALVPTPPRELDLAKPPTMDEWNKQWASGQLYMTGRAGAALAPKA